MTAPEPTPSPRAPRGRSLPSPVSRRATVIGAGSFGTALAVLLCRAGLRTTLQTRSAEQATRLSADRENKLYLPGVELPAQLRSLHPTVNVTRLKPYVDGREAFPDRQQPLSMTLDLTRKRNYWTTCVGIGIQPWMGIRNPKTLKK